MIVVLELKPEVEARLITLAAAQGMSVEEYIQKFIESLASLDEEHSMTAEQAECLFLSGTKASLGFILPSYLRPYSLTQHSLSGLPFTNTEMKFVAAAVIIGLNSKPKNG